MAQEIWFRSDLENILNSLDSVPVPSGAYAAGWRDGLAALGVAVGIAQRRAPSAWVVTNDREIAAAAAVLIGGGREVAR